MISRPREVFGPGPNDWLVLGGVWGVSPHARDHLIHLAQDQRMDQNALKSSKFPEND